MAKLAGKNKDTLDSEEVRTIAKRRAKEIGDYSEWYKLEELHELRLQRSKLLIQFAALRRVSVYLICLAQKSKARSVNVAVNLSSGTRFKLLELPHPFIKLTTKSIDIIR